MSSPDFSSVPVPVAPTTTLAWEARVTTTPRQSMGRGPAGERYIIPITGGTFEGPRGLRGTVLPGGADRQLWRPDGVRELDALYEMAASSPSTTKSPSTRPKASRATPSRT